MKYEHFFHDEKYFWKPIRMKKYMLIMPLFFIVGCHSGPDSDSMRAPPTAWDMSWSTKEGTATIIGSASIFVPDDDNQVRMPGGGGSLILNKGHTYTCAGRDVQLLPQSPASDPVVDHMFRYGTMTGPKVESAEVAPFVRHVTCDADGQFTFANLPAGIWYAVTDIWQGNIAVKEIRIQPGQTTSITLKHDWNYPPSWRHRVRLW
ncbi:hypothetical protein B0W47_05600 [Komagataeibacter nataicola]|uniref:Carboxypeptidase regulatory-like domain-containing protein n=2 Tax=Komagataeibacter TaxID=1434011 RepID=A0A9N7C6J5_9PROT|nr:MULTISPECIES: carboxypeptidase-like regulatory domain-containing protein [Komagataeibacter]AQU87041.1 hypothetical protein B0W47_05600 [Komagataeibacter nataicola]MBV0889213.1 carboxypeptidase-like regulatory domain-containing protein [Komagataeibacter oboediens]MBV1830213.1 carboxypeptidase-like regulatory domain-containing protein [Komagataeibacter melomenusus]MCK9821213.1 carboxypeptidase-like regulatory domain-containing protein [Komagataeibacter oboediens]NPC65697.1 carboxypeptidase re